MLRNIVVQLYIIFELNQMFNKFDVTANQDGLAALTVKLC